jgi:hypothetical protein
MIIPKAKLSRPAKIAVSALAVASTLMLAYFIVVALRRPDEREKKLSTWDVSELQAGRMKVWETEAFRYYAIRPVTGDLYVLATPLHNGKTPMPEPHWWKPKIDCAQFGLDSNSEVVHAESRFRCHDADQPKEWAERWQWDVRGRNIAVAGRAAVDNMFRVKFEQSDDEIKIVALETD